MNVTEVKKQIQSLRLSPFYVFTGEEIRAQRIYIDKISEITGKPVRRIDEVKEAFNKRGSLVGGSYLYVCIDDLAFWKAGVPVDNICELLGKNMLILQMTSIDGRSKGAKDYKEQIVEFKYMDRDVLYKYTELAVPLSDENAFTLIDMCECDYSRILSEADKINAYAQAQGVTVDTAFTQLVSNGTIVRPPQDAIFDFTNAMLRGQIDKAFSLLEECKGIGESPLRIISVLYTNFKRVLQYQVSSGRDVCAETGLSAYDVKLAKDTAGCWDSRDLVYFLKVLQRFEEGIKTGEIDQEYALDLLMVTML